VTAFTDVGSLLFDLDGCLVDSSVPITACMNHALADVGLPARDPADLLRFIGPPLPASFRIMLAEAGADEALYERCVEVYRARYPSVSLEDTRIIPGIEEVLDTFGGLVPMAVVTSKPREFAAPIVEALGLTAHFLAVHGPETDLQSEPKQVTLTRALRDVAPGLHPARAVMIGDREHDVFAGIACGTATIGVTWGAGDRAELDAAGADALIDTPAALPELLRDGFRSSSRKPLSDPRWASR
jgi:phosphoglycolate phosphatase